MSTEKKANNNNNNVADDDDDNMDRLARQLLLEEAKRNKIRAETQGALGWQKPSLVTNRKFLRNTLISNAVHNISKNEQEKQQRSKSITERKQNDYKYSRKRSRSPLPSSSSSTRQKRDDDDDDERLGKRTKKR